MPAGSYWSVTGVLWFADKKSLCYCVGKWQGQKRVPQKSDGEECKLWWWKDEWTYENKQPNYFLFSLLCQFKTVNSLIPSLLPRQVQYTRFCYLCCFQSVGLDVFSVCLGSRDSAVKLEGGSPHFWFHPLAVKKHECYCELFLSLPLSWVYRLIFKCGRCI